MAGKSSEGYSLQIYHLWLCVLASISVKWVVGRDKTTSHLVPVPFPGHVPLAVVGGCPCTPQLRVPGGHLYPAGQTQRTIQVRRKMWNWVLQGHLLQVRFNFCIRSGCSGSHHSHVEPLQGWGYHSVGCSWSRRLDTLIVKISSPILCSEILLLLHLLCRALELGAFTFVFIVFYSGVLFGELGFFVVVLFGFVFFFKFFSLCETSNQKKQVSKT